jgi:hypothetical protein
MGKNVGGTCRCAKESGQDVYLQRIHPNIEHAVSTRGYYAI